MLTALEYLRACEELREWTMFENIDRHICPDYFGYSDESDAEYDMLIDSIEEYEKFHRLGDYSPEHFSTYKGA